MTDNNHLEIEHPGNGIALFRLNRPKKYNALNTPLLRDLAAALEEADADAAIHVMIITGGDTLFAAGADINDMKGKTSDHALADVRPALWNKIRNIRKPIIAAVEGFCLGAGHELMMCCDIAIAGDKTKIGQPETNLGIIPGAGGAALLTKLIGPQQAMLMVLSGNAISAQEAKDLGLVAKVVVAGKANESALELAKKLSARAPTALRQAKAVIRKSMELPLSGALAFERQAFSLLFSTADKEEGIAAFEEKRDAKWTGS